jgi:hypothetical protein
MCAHAYAFLFQLPSYIRNKMCCVLIHLFFKPLVFKKEIHELMAYLIHQYSFVILSNLSSDVSIKKI